MDAPDDSAGSKLVNSVALTLIARGAMILAAGALPLGLWMINRATDASDRVASKVDSIREQSIEINGNVRLIQQTQGMQTQIIADHETRVRRLEDFSRRPMP